MLEGAKSFNSITFSFILYSAFQNAYLFKAALQKNACFYIYHFWVICYERVMTRAGYWQKGSRYDTSQNMAQNIFLSLLFSDAYCMMTGFMQLLRVGVFKRCIAYVFNIIFWEKTKFVRLDASNLLFDASSTEETQPRSTLYFKWFKYFIVVCTTSHGMRRIWQPLI